VTGVSALGTASVRDLVSGDVDKNETSDRDKDGETPGMDNRTWAPHAGLCSSGAVL
jgi:hypothetical protein